MIRVSQQNSAAGAKRYYATADYYIDGQELVGQWGGKGAARLGLSGTVGMEAFEQLCDNLDPRTGQQLTARTNSERTVGYDFTFSVPKSVSLLYALHDDGQILEAFRSTVDETMREMEAEMKTRVRTAGRDENRTTGNMVWAEFIHTTSRPVDGVPDPQLHAHCFVFNSTFDQEEERWKAGQFRELKRDAPYFQAAFRVRLANRLQDLGYGVVRKRDDFEIAGLPKDILNRFSRRTELIEQIAQEKGITDPDRKAELGAETREHKGKNLSMPELREEWRSRLSQDEQDWIAEVHRRETTPVRPGPGERSAVDHAIRHSFVRDAVVPERKLMTEALKRGLGVVMVERTAKELEQRPLIRSVAEGRDVATTQEMLALETRMVDFARDGRGRCRPLGNPKRPVKRTWLNEEQQVAVRHVLGSRDRVMVIRGVAGTGKTTLEQEIGEALAEAGKPVVALAQTVKASREVLRTEAGFDNADTVARFLADTKVQASAKAGVILVDEASQLGTQDMLAVFSVAEKVNARVILVGDRRQHKSVTAGEPLKLLEDRAGLPVAEVTVILRQSGEYKQIAKALSEGQVGPAFEGLDQLGWIRQVGDDERYQQLASAYLDAVKERTKEGKAKTALVVSPMHAEAAKVTDAIRTAMKEEGTLTEERVVTAYAPAHLTGAQKTDVTEYEPGDLIQFHQNATGYVKGTRLIVDDTAKPPIEQAERFEVYRPKSLALAVGDRIRITAGGTTKDGEHRLSNGALFTVEGFTPQGDIMVNNGWVIDREFGHLTHGYVTTSHASQGATVNKVFVAINSESLKATDQRTAYVAVTRGKEQAVIFTDDHLELLKAAKRAGKSLTATELVDSKIGDGKSSSRVLANHRLGLNRSVAPEFTMPTASREMTRDRENDHAR
ncbi:MAG: relaxase domain-containing protein [Bacteroidales bacterium]|nr:relaxase domain-containing protein [Bacteroidales bacterium]